MMVARIKNQFQRADEHGLMRVFEEEFKGYEEAEDISEILDNSDPYLPHHGCLGEMVLSVGGAIYLYEKGADGIADISPFTCMRPTRSRLPHPECLKELSFTQGGSIVSPILRASSRYSSCE